MQTLSDIGEDLLIQRLVDDLPQGDSVIVGPGDDCAVVKGTTEGHHLLLKTDAVAEGVHFLRDAPPHLIGRKALARAISDIGAMGGIPLHALVTLVLPVDLDVAFVQGLYQGMRELADEFSISIVGGETTRGLQIVISVTLTGEVEADRQVLRSTAREGDAIMVTGRLGGSIKGHHFTFRPRLQEARWLVQHHRPNAMMDLSDGLAKDLPRLAAASGLDFVIEPGALPCNPGCTAAQAWGDGEDYELLFMIADETELMSDWAQSFPEVSLTKIGNMVATGQGSVPDFDSTGWDPFVKDGGSA
ncbi:MAG: thiamine-monophosphate kinase [Verrucomicrobiaceae bacterium]|nr:thiamine-monophosphate kinase [Verrucomicrobiaceae bacterium]